jgi:hypothetical protein
VSLQDVVTNDYDSPGRKSGDTDAESLALYAALETVWKPKRSLKAEIEAKRAERFKAWWHDSIHCQ